MNAFIFPGQGVQREGMGKDLFESFAKARDYFESANKILDRHITDVMFHGSELELLETKNTQPAVFLYSTILALTQNEIKPDIVAGHSLGEFCALVVSGVLSFKDGLNLDMISRNNPDSLKLIGARQNPDLVKVVRKQNKEIGFTLNESKSRHLGGGSDHVSFFRNGVPSLFFFTGLHKDYHRVTDNPELVDADKASRVARLVFMTAWKVANESKHYKIVKSDDGEK